MSDILYRLGKIEEKITDPNIFKKTGFGNEVGYYLFDYEPKDELKVRNHIKYLIGNINKSNSHIDIIEFDIYDIMIKLLQEEGLFNDCLDIEKEEGTKELFERLIPALGLNESNDRENNLIINYIMKNIDTDNKSDENTKSKMLFLTGIGKCFPIIRSQTILSNLHQLLDNHPVILFFPGKHLGQEQKLFGTLTESSYYAILPLVP